VRSSAHQLIGEFPGGGQEFIQPCVVEPRVGDQADEKYELGAYDCLFLQVAG
jgi:hypothetical protein